MSKRTDINGYHVKVFVPVGAGGGFSGPRKMTPDQAMRKADEIRAAIVRHLAHEFGDYWEGIWREIETNEVCDSCGMPWTEKSTAYNGGCCDADEADHEQTIADNGSLGVGR